MKLKRKTKTNQVCLLCVFAFLFSVGLPHAVFARERHHKRILLVSSYFPDKENSKIIINSFSQKLSTELDCRITVEYMDSESTTEPVEWVDWMKQLFRAYNTPPDLIVIIGCEGWMSYTIACPEEWKDIPIVLGFMKESYIDYAHLSPTDIKNVKDLLPTEESFGDFKATGYYVTDYFRENMQLIKQLQPQVKHVTYIYDNRYGFNFLTSYLQKIARETGFESLQAYYGHELTTMQLVDSLVVQDASYAILSSGWYTDVLHYPHAYSMLHNELSLLNEKHFYLVMDQGMTNPSYLGGYYVAATDIGTDLAGLAYEVLVNGFEHSPKFQRTPSEPKYHMNYKTLLNTGIASSRLPSDAILYNKEPSFLHKYFWQLLVISLTFISVILILLFRMRYYRRVTEVKARMMEEQKELRERADESNRLKSAFLANMSHEIRTPLNAIVGFSNQLAYTQDKEDIQMFLEIIETNNALLLQLINDILDLSKIEAGTLDFIYTDTDVVEICRNLRMVYLSRVKEGVELRCELPDEQCVIHTERNRITQVISNFLSNAVKFTEEGYIRLGYEHVEGGLRFFVEDTGKGIAPENLSRVFVRFEKFDKFVPGNGLGMSICKSIVEKMEGQIDVGSELSKGSTFWFILPCDIIQRKGQTEVAEEKEKEELSPLAEVASTGDDSNRKTILIAEDNDSNYLLLTCILKKNYHLVWAKDGQQAVNICRKVHPDLILMDIKMPVLDGVEATAQIRKENKEVPIIALSAYAFAEDKAKALKAGCTDFLTKPVNQGKLYELLHEQGL